MTMIKFNSEKERKAHPQAKRINPYLMEKVFQQRLTSQEIDALAIDVQHLNAMDFERCIKDYDKCTKNEKYRIYLSLLLSHKTKTDQNSKKDLDLLHEIGSKLLRLTNFEIMKASAMSGRLDMIKSFYNKSVHAEELKNILTSQDVLTSVGASGNADTLNELLNFTVSSNLKIKDFLITADLRSIYVEACSYGYIDIIKHLDAIEGFNRLEAASANDYLVYLIACENGHLDVIKHLENIPGFNLSEAVSADKHGVYHSACKNGHLDVIKHLDRITEYDPAYSYSDYRSACENGHLDVIKHLESFARFNRLKHARFNHCETYLLACEDGHLDVIKHLEAIAGFNQLEAAIVDDYAPYRGACKNGHLDVIKHLEAIAGFNQLKAAIVKDYAPYRCACENGHLDVIKHLEAIAGFNQLEAAIVNDYAPYRCACKNGHLDVIKHLEAIAGFNQLEAAGADNYKVYGFACERGHLDVIKHLENITGFNQLAAASADNYKVYGFACERGHLDVIKHLENIAGFNQLEAASANHWFYGLACRNGHLDVITHLENIAGFNRLQAANIHAERAYMSACENGRLDVIEHFEAFNQLGAESIAYDAACACQNGHLNVIKHLENIEGFDKKRAASANNYRAYERACAHGHLDIIKYFLVDADCFLYTESHDREYGDKYTYGWVDLKLKQLSHAKEAFYADTPGGVFDLSDEDARYYMCILRNLIRRGVDREYVVAENTHDLILSLLEIPSIKSRCHQPIREPGQENELLRFAMAIGNESAASTLLNIPAVREIALRNDFYQSERRGGIDLTRLAQDRESSMTALTEGERKRLSRIEQQYGSPQQERGVDNAFYQLKLQLEEKYNANPASITNASGEVVCLPCDWAKFQTLGLLGEEKEEALKAYYQHATHTAYRYLSRPNHWIAQNSSWVNVNPTNPTERWSTFEEYKPLIALMYLASIDEKSVPTQGHTVESRFEHFIKELALIGRAHNWDDKRARTHADGRIILEEYDDLKADKPSCFSGVKRRLFQSLVGHKDFDILTFEVIEQEIQSFYRDAITSLLKEPQFTTDRLELILADFHQMAMGSDCDYEAFLKLNINQKNKDVFKSSLEKKYGAALTEFIFFLNDKLTTSLDGDFLRFATAYDLVGIIEKEIASSPDSTMNTINRIDNMDDLLDYLKSPLSWRGENQLQPRLFYLFGMPGQFKIVLEKLRPAKLSEVLQFKNPKLHTAHHQLLMLDQETFDAFLKKLELNQLKTLLLIPNDSGQSFLYEAINSPDLSETLQQHILENEALKAWLMSEKTQINALLGILQQPKVPSVSMWSTVKTREALLLDKLSHAIHEHIPKLSDDEVKELQKMASMTKPIALLAKAKSMSVDDFYVSITDNRLSASPS